MAELLEAIEQARQASLRHGPWDDGAPRPAVCRCGKPVQVVTTSDGRTLRIDTVPSEEGTVTLVTLGVGTPPVADVLGEQRLRDPRYAHLERFTLHARTCATSRFHKRRRV